MLITNGVLITMDAEDRVIYKALCSSKATTSPI